ncbi:MAG: hypothetical protein EZS28_004839 [Streblomastix strix]|uniref:Uncharacterized protein n=1 Tax=Streblomastix strix TaxID=222440 RepID=A0A5J4WXU5_9EUKA|nr:MAG: hypothetical protein EZS28_004839 [Streblomastix strix]
MINRPPGYLNKNKKDESRPSVILIMDVGLRIGEVIKGDTDPISLIFADKVSTDAVYRDDIETGPYNKQYRYIWDIIDDFI